MSQDIYAVVQARADSTSSPTTVAHYNSLALATIVQEAGESMGLNWEIETITVTDFEDYDEY